MSKDNLLLAEVAIGLDVRAFLATDVGKLITGRAGQELDEARMELETLDPEDTRAIRAAQSRIAVCRNIITWLADAIGNGRQAEAILSDRDVSE